MRELPEGKKVTKCRICGGDIVEILDLGHHPPSDKFLTEEQLDEPEVRYPLRLFYCPKCTLAQLDYIVPKETLFSDDYPYETGVNQGGIVHFHTFADEVYEKFGKPDSFVVDIGGNDGTFLEGFALHGCKVLNVDPCGVKSKVMSWKNFWGSDTAKEISTQFGKADIITATNVLAHTEDLHDFMKGVNVLLKDDGVLVIETPSLDAMIDGLQFDQIYHEHLGYFSPISIEILLQKHNFKIISCIENSMHGGSLRIYAGRGESDIYPIPDFSDYLKEFAEKVKELRKQIRWYINEYTVNCGVAASAKGNTLLNYCGINSTDFKFITDKSKLKQGKYTPGSHILVVDDDILTNCTKRDTVLMLACNFKKNIVKAVRDKGYKGKFIIPYPTVSVE
jgi:hypothetical protein